MNIRSFTPLDAGQLITRPYRPLNICCSFIAFPLRVLSKLCNSGETRALGDSIICIRMHKMSGSIFCSIILCLFLIPVTRSARIVGFAKMAFVSHNRLLFKLGQELQTRGHKYTQILPNFAKEIFEDVDIKIFNTSVTNDDIQDWSLRLANVGNFDRDLYAIFELLTKVVPQYNRIREQYCEDFLKHQDLIAELKASADLLLCDVANDCCSILADILNITRVEVGTVGFGGLYGAYLFGYPDLLMYATLEVSQSLTNTNKFSFLNRLKGVVQYVSYSFLHSHFSLDNLWEKYAKAHSKFKHAANARTTRGIAIILHDFALEQAIPLGANIKVIGAILPEPARKLPEYLEKFMSENKVVVLVSLGSIFSNYPAALAQSIADTLSQVSAAVLWQYSGEMPQNLGKNIKIVQWFPNLNDVLGHSSTKVFVTHGGLNSIQESVYHGVPMVIVPMFADQPRRASFLQNNGLGVAIEWRSVSANGQVLKNAIHDVLHNKAYKEKVKKISVIMKDRKMTPTEEGADWIEYALRHDGALHLTNETIDLPVYKLYMFDVLIFLLVSVCLLIYVLLRLCRWMSRACWRKVPIKEKLT